MTMFYALRDGEPYPVTDIMVWAREFDNMDRRVARTEVGETVISTVFLGMNHALFGPPMLYETMVFGGLLDEEMERYSNLEDAMAGHERMVAHVRAVDGGAA